MLWFCISSYFTAFFQYCCCLNNFVLFFAYHTFFFPTISLLTLFPPLSLEIFFNSQTPPLNKEKVWPIVDTTLWTHIWEWGSLIRLSDIKIFTKNYFPLRVTNGMLGSIYVSSDSSAEIVDNDVFGNAAGDIVEEWGFLTLFIIL